MMISLHKNVQTTSAVRREVAVSAEAAAVLTVRYGITE